MFRPRRGIVCIICNRSVLRRRRLTLTNLLFEQNPTAARFIINNVGVDQIEFNNAEFICRPCYQRASASSGATPQSESVSRTPQDTTAARNQVGVLVQDASAAAPQQIDVPAQSAPDAPRQVDLPAQDIHEAPHTADEAVQDVPIAPLHVEVPASLQEFLLPDVSRPPNSARTCMVSECQRRQLHRIPEKQKIRLMQRYNYYIPEFARICDVHLQSNDWERMTSAPNVIHRFTAEQVTDMINMLKKAAERASRLDFENIEEFDEEELYYFMGLKRQEFLTIIEQTPSLSASCNQPNSALAIMLMKLRTGEPNERLSLLFHMSRRSLERLMKTARNALTRDFVPAHLGWDNITREQIAQRNLQIPNALFGNSEAEMAARKAIIICDGTYIYINKSSNFLFQIETYSPHKYNNLLKPFMFVCSDGYIIEVTGPHGAKKSDASIMQDIIDNEEHPFHCQFNPDDVFILDRGFRDVVPELEALGYEVHMPRTVDSGETQLTATQANESRKVTLVRWVVEVVNGRIKRDFKLFRQEYFHSAMPHMFEDLRIACALLNCFHVPITDSEYAEHIIQRVIERQNMPNILGEFVTGRRMNQQRVIFEEMNADLPGLETFPTLTQRELIIFALGTYQMKLAKSYYSEHVRGTGYFSISIYRDPEHLVAQLNDAGIEGSNLWLLRAKIQSRYTRTKVHYTYILVNDDESGLNALKHYYCSCKIGNRTLGCCAHVMVITWFLSLARYEENIHRPALFLDSVIIDNNH